MRKLFISYRRDDTQSVTGRLYDGLVRRFGKSNIFKDVHNISGGSKFRDVISAKLNESKVLLVVIGPDWLDARTDSGERRIDHQDDYVRYEIKSALSNPDCVVIPVLVRNQSIPNARELPEDIKGLVDSNAIPLRPDPDFSKDFEKLCKNISEHVPPKRRWPVPLTLIVCVIVAVLGAYIWGVRNDLPDTTIRIFDDSTGERIERSFVVEFEKEAATEAATSHVLADRTPDDTRIADIVIDPPVFAYGKSQLPHRIERTEDGWDVMVPLTRLEILAGSEMTPNKDIDGFSYLELIKPDLDTVRLPSDDHIMRQVAEEVYQPDECELIIDNETSSHIEVILYWMRPPDSTPAGEENDAGQPDLNPFLEHRADFQRIPVKPDGRTSFKSFRLPTGYFVFFGSSHGKTAVLLGSESVYKAPFTHARISELSTDGCRINPRNKRPPEMTNRKTD